MSGAGRTSRTWAAAAGALAAAVLVLGAKCGGGDGGGGAAPVVRVESPDSRCVALASEFPAGFDFVPGLAGQVLVTNEEPQSVLRFDVQQVPFGVPPGTAPFSIPPDSDGDGLPEGTLLPPGLTLPNGQPLVFLPSPVLDDVNAVAPDLALVTASGYEAVLFVDAQVAPRSVAVSVPAATPATQHPLLPAPGTSELRTGLSTFVCVVPPPGAVDSRGDLLVNVLPASALCPPGAYVTRFTSGAALAGGRLFVSTSNAGDALFSTDTQYLPGTVLVFDFDTSVDPPVASPHPTTPVLFTTAFNPTHVTPYTTPGGRELVLVSVTGAVGIVRDDPATSVPEGGGVGLTDGAIDVIDPAVPALLATIPLRGANPAFGELAIDPSGRVALAGDAVRRNLYAVDLEPLDGLGAPGPAPVVLDGSAGANAIVFDGAVPFRIPERAGGAPPASCPGFTPGVAVNQVGDRAYVTEQCDGTLTTVGIDLAGAPPVPVPTSRFRLISVAPITSPLRPDTIGEPRQPGTVRVRPGRPGIDFTGPDVFFSVGTPEGLLCGLSLESGSP